MLKSFYMLTANASKIKKSSLSHINLVLNVLLEMRLFLSEWDYVLRSENVNLTKACFFLNEATLACVNAPIYYITSSLYDTTHLCSCTVIIRNCRKIQRPLKFIWVLKSCNFYFLCRTS